MLLVEQIIAGLTVAVITGGSIWLWRDFFRPELQILTVIEQGPTSREFGFTEPAVKITVMNKSSESVQIKDICLIFCGDFGGRYLRKHRRAVPIISYPLVSPLVQTTIGISPPRNSQIFSLACITRRKRVDLRLII